MMLSRHNFEQLLHEKIRSYTVVERMMFHNSYIIRGESGRRVVLKEMVADPLLATKVKNTATLLEELWRLGYHTHRIIPMAAEEPIVTINGHPYICLTYIEGVNPRYDDSAALSLALSRYHKAVPHVLANLKLQTTSERLTVAQNQLGGFANVSGQLGTNIRRLLPTLDRIRSDYNETNSASIVCHGDATINNTLITASSPVLFDFDRIHIGSLWDDLAVMYLSMIYEMQHKQIDTYYIHTKTEELLSKYSKYLGKKLISRAFNIAVITHCLIELGLHAEGFTFLRRFPGTQEYLNFLSNEAIRMMEEIFDEERNL